MRKLKENHNRDNRYNGRDLNGVTSKYEAGEPPTTLFQVLEKLTVAQIVNIFSVFMESEMSLPNSQDTTQESCLGPGESGPQIV